MDTQKGVTVIELMVAVAVLAVLASVAVPSYRFLVIKNDIASHSNRLLATLLYARSESAKRNLSVSVCWSASGTTCGGTVSQGWDDGWIVFVDTGADGSFHTATDTIIRIEGPVSGGTSLKSSYANFVRYEPTGSSNTFGSFTLCSEDNDPQFTRQLDVSGSGRPRISEGGTCT